jgi:Fic family protein
VKELKDNVTEAVRYHLNGFPPSIDRFDWKRLVPLIGQANAALARYDGLVTAIPNANILLSPLTTQEAVLSSKIEGTNVTMTEVLEVEAGAERDFEQSKLHDVQEILNYRKALNFAAKSLGDRPLSPHLLRETHNLLMQGVRGRDKSPGAFRSEQNWIGSQGCGIEQANFIPVPQEHLLAGIDKWASYIQSQDEPDPLVQLAAIHVEFEALHPFKDGNGRLGRMIIPLFLYSRGLLKWPNFYMSTYLEARREEYVQAMRSVSRDGAWTDWSIFFLRGLIDQASENQSKAQAILTLHQRMQAKIAELTHSQFSPYAVDFIFSRPIFTSPEFVENSRIPRPSAQRLLNELRNAGVLRAIRKSSGRRSAVYAFAELVNIAEGHLVV